MTYQCKKCGAEFEETPTPTELIMVGEMEEFHTIVNCWSCGHEWVAALVYRFKDTPREREFFLSPDLTNAELAEFEAELGLRETVWERFFNFLKHA